MAKRKIIENGRHPADFPPIKNIFIVPVIEPRNRLPAALATLFEKRLDCNFAILEHEHSHEGIAALGRVEQARVVKQLKDALSPQNIKSFHAIEKINGDPAAHESIQVLKYHDTSIIDTEKEATFTAILATIKGMEGKYFISMHAYSKMITEQEDAAVAELAKVVEDITATLKRKDIGLKDGHAANEFLYRRRAELLKQDEVFRKITENAEYALGTEEIIAQPHKCIADAHSDGIVLGEKELRKYNERMRVMNENWDALTKRLVKETIIIYKVAMGLLDDMAKAVKEIESRLAGQPQ